MPKKCGAKAKSTGKPCGRWALENGRCKYHGGESLKGAASPKLIHGRWSKDAPTRIAARLEERLDDPDLLDLSDEIRLIDARIGELLASIDTGETGRIWKALRAEYRALQQANRQKPPDLAAAAVHLTTMGGLIERGDSDQESWRALMSAVDNRRRLVESERKRLVELNQVITTEQAFTLVARVLGAVKQHVTDPIAYRAIAAELGAAVN